MLEFLKKDKKEEEEKTQIDVSGVAAKELHAFIPFYAHYNPDTLITKNGELLKIIKIDSNNFGLNYESSQDDQHTVRATIRQAINQTIRSDQFAIWVHMLRRRKPIQHEGKYDDPFAAYVYEKWKLSNDWQFQFYNEMYITILHDGQGAELVDREHLGQVVLPRQNRIYRNQYLEGAMRELDDVCNHIVEKIGKHYNARILRLVERLPEDMPQISNTPIFYSEPMEFLGKLCNLTSQAYPVGKTSMDKTLSNYEVTFGYNAMENRPESGEKRFAGILTVKQYVETPPEIIDRILQLPVELIVSHAFHYVPAPLAIKLFRDQKRLFDISEDRYSMDHSGLHKFLNSNRKNPTDFGKQQASVMVITDDYRKLDEEMSKVQQAFGALGLLAIREDIKLEECYWSQLPGNFEFLRRQDIIASRHMAGLCRLNLYPNGNQENNHWGDAVALVPTIVDSPYFFNFHHQDNGHTLLFDFNSFHDQAADALVGLLSTLCMKYNPRLYVFDHNQGARLFMDKVKGNYCVFDRSRDTDTLTALNPFSLENAPRNQAFLNAWCTTLVEGHIALSENQKNILRQSIVALYEGPEGSRHLLGLVEIIRTYDQGLADAFADFHGRGTYAGLFDATRETVNFAAALHAFDMSKKLRASPAGVPLFSYLMHRIINNLDGRPTIIVLHEAWTLLENEFFAPRMESLLEMLRQNNVMVISTTQNPADCAGSRTLQTLMQSCATRIYVPDDISLTYTSDILGISQHDSNTMRRMNRQKGEFLLKQGNETIGLRVGFEHMDDARAIFSGDIKNLIASGGPFASLPKYH